MSQIQEKSSWLKMVFAIATVALPTSALALDPGTPFVCAAEVQIECVPERLCLGVQEDSDKIAPFLEVDPEAMTANGAGPGALGTSLEIKYYESINGLLIVQGSLSGNDASDTLGWTMTVQESDGQMMVTASSFETAMVVYGSCIDK